MAAEAVELTQHARTPLSHGPIRLGEIGSCASDKKPAVVENRRRAVKPGREALVTADRRKSQVEEDGFAAGIAGLLNQKVLSGHIADLFIVAAPRRFRISRRLLPPPGPQFFLTVVLGSGTTVPTVTGTEPGLCS